MHRSAEAVSTPGVCPANGRRLPAPETRARAEWPATTPIGREPGTGVLEEGLSSKYFSSAVQRARSVRHRVP